MATALTAQGIGFSGVPRDYTAIVMQGKRQKQLDEQAAKEKKDKEYDKLYEQINIKDPTKFFSFDLQDIKRTTAETIDKLAKAKASGNYAEAQKITSDYNTTIGSLQQQKIDYDAKVKTGKYIFDPDLINFENSPTREEAVKKYGQSEGVVSENNQFRFNATPNFDDSTFFTNVAKDPNVVMLDGYETVKDADGNSYRREKFKINVAAFDARLKNAMEDPQLLAAEAAKYRIKNPKWRELSPLEFEQNVKDDFIERGRTYAQIPKNKERNIGKADITNVTVNSGNGEKIDEADLNGISNVRLKFKSKVKRADGSDLNIDYDVPAKAVGAVKDISATYPNTIGLIDVNTGQPIKKAGVTVGKYNVNSVAEIVTKDIYVGGYNIYAGTIVSAEDLDKIIPGLAKLVYEQGDVKPGVVSFGIIEDADGVKTEVYRSAEFTDQTQGVSLSKEDALKLEKIKNLRDPAFKNLEKNIERVKGKGKAAAPAPAPAPAAVKKKEAAQTKPAATKPTGETKTKDERVKANPKLKNLPQ